MKYKERALAHKQCYIKLNDLQFNAKRKEDASEPVDDLFQSYNEILSLTENHSEYDYFKVKFFNRGNEEYLSIGWKEKIKLFVYWSGVAIFSLILILLPFIMVYFDK